MKIKKIEIKQNKNHEEKEEKSSVHKQNIKSVGRVNML
jgi:hypothetical protein